MAIVITYSALINRFVYLCELGVGGIPVGGGRAVVCTGCFWLYVVYAVGLCDFTSVPVDVSDRCFFNLKEGLVTSVSS